MLPPLADGQLMELSLAMKRDQAQVAFHDYIQIVRDYVDGRDLIEIPQSHKGLMVGDNHEGGHRLNVRIKQGAAWLANGVRRFSVTPGSSEYHDQAEQMERFARSGEAQFRRGTQLHKWRMESARDMFECGLAIVQTNPRREFYIKARDNRDLFTRGARLTDVFHNRRVDPLWSWWLEGEDGDLDGFMIEGKRKVSELAKVINDDLMGDVRNNFKWAESLPDSRISFDGTRVEVDELWVNGQGVLIYSGTGGQGKGSKMKADDPRRIIARWQNLYPRVPFYLAPATTAPYHSPLDEMVALTGERNYWATMLDRQASGAVFRHWQLADTNTGEGIAPQLWANPVPETVLLDLTKPPPNMGPGTEWKLAPFEMNDVLPRHAMIVEQHESAGASVARLVGQAINANTAVGTADMMEDYARREFSDILASDEDATAARWVDIFGHIRKYHTREPVVVSGRKRDMTDMKFKPTHLELTGDEVIAEDVEVTNDTRTRMALVADWRIGREMRSAGDMSFDRAVEQGLVPYVDDAVEEKADIFQDQVQNVILEIQVQGVMYQTMQSLGLPIPGEVPPVPPANITRGNQHADPRGNAGAGKGPNNASDTALAAGATDMVRAA